MNGSNTLGDPESARWKALSSRQSNPIDAFVYAVVTTGVFCLPQCASRRPRPENVRFFDDWRSAARAGYRPCKRCKPAGSGSTASLLTRACEHLAQEAAVVSEAAGELGLSEAALRRLFQSQLGVTPRAYQKSARLNQWKREIHAADGPLDAAFAAGYGSSRALYENSTERLGMTPGSYAKGGRGMKLEYEVAPHDLGAVFVAGTEKGVSFVALGTDTEAMLAELRHDYPEAELLLRAGSQTRWAPAVLKALSHPELGPGIPLDVQATAFQARVWKALQEIPPGETRTYSGLAAELGNPAATRAVARACATNRVSILIPCHRVVGVSGDLTGYRWGKERKAALLDAERRWAAQAQRTAV